MSKPPYIQDEDKQEYRRFCIHHLKQYGRHPVPEVWHYTTADGLIAILTEGKLFATQVTCLNDNLEQRYFGDLLHEAVKEKLSKNTDPSLTALFKSADRSLSDRDFSTAWHFVTCFSEAEDDLAQWRGYGGGECGYAIGFSFEGILEALKTRPNALFAPMQYQDNMHRFVVDEVLRVGQEYFLQGISRGYERDRWTQEFVEAFAWELDIFASTTKHPKFSGEQERRIIMPLGDGEHQSLEFRQKHTLLSRHLPVDLTVSTNGMKRLPITRVYVGPSPARRVSQVSVGDLLLKCGYKDIDVELSKVPYRLP